MASSFKSLTINDTGYLKLPSGTNADRPAATPTVQSFTSVGTTSWTCPANVTQVEVLVVAGGGGGGGGGLDGGGGGAGGLIYNPAYPVTPGQSYTVTVGAGGSGIGATNTTAANGGNSVFGTLTAIGGGGGANGSVPGAAGGSGGGGGGDGGAVTKVGGAGTTGQGFPGGFGNDDGGGGGGAGQAGYDAVTPLTIGTKGGRGGDGLQFTISGTPTWYAGGGGGAGENGALGGLGGGGAGATSSINGTNNGLAGAANTGGGGGGTNNSLGGDGGSGIVIVKYVLDANSEYPVSKTRFNSTTNTTEAFNINNKWTPTGPGNSTITRGLLLNLDASCYGSGSTWNDLSGVDNHGTLYNTTYDSSYSGNFVFNGTSSYVNASTVTLSGTLPQISYGVWVKADNTTWRSAIAGGTTGNNNTIQIAITNGTTVNGYMYLGSWKNAVNGTINLGQWNYILVTYDNSYVRTYINGELASAQPETATFPGLNFVTVGNQQGSQFFSGSIAIAQVYSRALTPEEVRQNYNAQCTRFGLGKTEPVAPITQSNLVAHFDASDPSSYPRRGSTWYNLASGSNQTFGATPTWANGYLEFNGSSVYSTGNGKVGIIGNYLSPYTVSIWCYRLRNNATEEMLSQWTTANSGNSFYLGFDSSNVRFTDNWNPITVSGAGTLNTWMNLVAVYSVTNAYIYLNGELKAVKGSGFTYTGTANLVFGRQGELSGEYFQGRIGNVQIYNRALTQNEIYKNFQTLRYRYGV